jgi:hypothetical protein
MVARIRKRICKWPRFSRYEIRDERIAPAGGAKIHWYDPWSDYLRSKTETRGQSPYMSLVALVDRLKGEFRAIGWDLLESAGIPPLLSEQAMSAVIAWTTEHGPLGVFSQTTPQIEEPAGGRAWTLAGGRWHQSQVWPARTPQDGTCLMAPVLGGPDLERRDARAHLLRFLGPHLPTEMPAPDSEEFFTLYGEPLWDWIAAAMTTVEAIFERDEDTLNVLAGAAARVRRFEGERVQSRIVFPSLLSAFAEMSFQDVEGGNRLGKCAFCGDLFITDRKWTAFCSPRCATKERQRRFLEKNPAYYRRAAQPQATTVSKRGKVKS